MLKDSSAGYYHKNKERLQKRTHERYQDLSKEKNTTSDNMFVNNVEIFQKKKNQKASII